MYDCLSHLSKVKRYSIISFLFVCLQFSHTAYSQKLVQDSLVLRLNTSDFENFLFPFSIDTVLDFRSVPFPRLLGIDETEIYGLVPVDLHILTSQPISEIIQNPFLKQAERSTTPLYIGLKNFEISNRPLLAVLKRYQINARLLGQTVEVLVEDRKKGKWQGRTRSGKLVFFSRNADCRGQLVKIKIEQTSPWSLQGKVKLK